MSVTHIKCASLTREASTQLPSVLRLDAAIAAPSAMRAQHERDLYQLRQPHVEAGAQTPSSLQPNAAVAVPGAMHAQHERDSQRRPPGG